MKDALLRSFGPFTNEEMISLKKGSIHELTDDEKIKLRCEARERYERDMASAIAKGKRDGIEEGREDTFQLLQKLMKDGRADLIEKAANDVAYREELYKEYGI